MDNQRKPIPPNSFAEVEEFFFLQKKSKEEAVAFFNHFEAVGWYSNNQPIINWRAKALNWSKGKFDNNQNPPPDNEQQAREQKDKDHDFWNRKW